MTLFWTYPVAICTLYPIALLREAVRFKAGRAVQLPPRYAWANRLLFWTHLAVFASIIGTCATAAWMANKDNYGVGWRSKDYLASMVGVGLFFAVGLLPDPDHSYTVSGSQQLTWLVSLAFETAFLTMGFQSMSTQGSQQDIDPLLVAEAIFNSARVVLFVAFIALYWGTRQRPLDETSQSDEETQALLNGQEQNGVHYGTDAAKPLKPEKRSGDAQTGTWTNYILGFQKLFPFLWPADSRRLQVQACFCFCLLMLERLVNILVPHQLGVLVESLAPGRLPHKELLLYVLFRWLQGGQGLIGSMRSVLWIPISQSTYRRLSTATFEHVLHLSLDFHLSKRIGEVTSALSKGSSLNTFLDGFAFRLFPMVADLFIAAIYFFLRYDAFYAEIVIAMTGIYVFVTIYMAKFRGRMRREMATRSRDMHAARTEALSSYETVHYSSAAVAETSRFSEFMRIYQNAEFKVSFSLSLLNAVQNAVFTLGTLLVCYLNAYQISLDLQQVAMFVTLLTYLAQLQAPLNFFGTFYTMVQNNLVDAERMLELFHETPTVQDKEDAVSVPNCNGGISFSNVSFSYNDGNLALKDVSFDVPPGSSLAVVGETGSGKSTLLKLLFRFYDVNDGQVKLDNLDIRDGKIEDIRRHLGVVPQDTVLFNETLMYNLQYTRPDATPEEVYEACRAASIHDKILQFPNGYMTVVGERGLKLSGGERQRIAIARAILKSPRILLMDEATASLDTQTESQIQASLDKVSQGRTTITIAHRLSTITKSDQILVLSNGSVIERGTHAELLQNKGQYFDMWNKQTDTSSTSSDI